MPAIARSTLFALLFILTNTLSHAAEEPWSWRQPYADVLANGDLKWTPKPFVFEKGDSIRYIDFESGDDSSDGASKEKPWKHHPWDAAATGNAKALQRHPYLCLQRRRLLSRRTQSCRIRKAPTTDPPDARSVLGQW